MRTKHHMDVKQMAERISYAFNMCQMTTSAQFCTLLLQHLTYDQIHNQSLKALYIAFMIQSFK